MSPIPFDVSDRPTRKHERVRTTCSALATLEGDAVRYWECQAFDLSREGMGLFSKSPIPIGAHLRVELTASEGSRRTLEGTVTYCISDRHHHRVGLNLRAQEAVVAA